MDILKLKILNDKVTNLIKRLEVNQPSAIERDLLLGHLTKMYDQVLEMDLTPLEKSKPQIQSEPEVLDYPQEDDFKVRHMAPPVEVTNPEPEPVLVGGLDPVTEKYMRLEVNAEEVLIPDLVIDETYVEPETTFTDTASFQTEEDIKISTPEPIYGTPLDPKWNEIFDVIDTNELSSKLALSKIDHLSEAFGLNDRLMLISELFEGNGQAFEKLSNDLEKRSTYDEAKSYIADQFAGPNDWLDDRKKEFAQYLMKSVYRLYA